MNKVGETSLSPQENYATVTAGTDAPDKSDVWQCGGTLFSLVRGRLPLQKLKTIVSIHCHYPLKVTLRHIQGERTDFH